jgi:hypothetical protein
MGRILVDKSVNCKFSFRYLRYHLDFPHLKVMFQLDTDKVANSDQKEWKFECNNYDHGIPAYIYTCAAWSSST